MDILREFWYGNVNPQEEYDRIYEQKQQQRFLIGRNYDKLYDTLTKEQQVL